jgi:hypothetical protein
MNKNMSLNIHKNMSPSSDGFICCEWGQFPSLIYELLLLVLKKILLCAVNIFT